MLISQQAKGFTQLYQRNAGGSNIWPPDTHPRKPSKSVSMQGWFPREGVLWLHFLVVRKTEL